MAWRGVIEEYRSRLPVTDKTPVITLHEGGTPLLPAPALSDRTGCEVYLKVEGGNPTGSFKDRGMTVALSMAVGAGAKAVICASTGNTSASAAAYAARAGITCAVLVPRGKIAIGKLAQALVHGAKLLQVDGSFDDCLELARKLAVDYPVALVNYKQPGPAAGPEDRRVRDRGRARRRAGHSLPAGRQRGQHHRVLDGVPRVLFRWRGRALLTPDVRFPALRWWPPIVDGAPVLLPQTIATAIRIGNPASWSQAEAARDSSGGVIDKVTDREILAAYRFLASQEAVFGELGSSASRATCSCAAPDGFDPAGLRGLHDHRQRPEGSGLGTVRRPLAADHPHRRRRRRQRPGPSLMPAPPARLHPARLSPAPIAMLAPVPVRGLGRHIPLT